MWLTLLLLIFVHFVHPETMLLSIDRVGMHAMWFFLGIVICKEDIVERVFLKSPWITMIVGLVLYFADAYIPLSGTIGLIVFSFGLALIADKYLPSLFCGFRNYTYQIFLIGIFAQMAVKIAYRHLSMPYVVAYLMCIILGLYIPVLLSKLIEKINWKPLSLCVGLKTK